MGGSMGMREGLRIFFRRWRAAAPGQQQESFLALLLMLVALGILCAERLAPPAPLCALLCVCALLLGVFLVWRQRPSAWLALAVLFFALGGLRFLAADALPLADVSRLAGQEAHVEGRLRAAPVLRTDAQGMRHVRYEVEAVSVQAAGGRRQSAAGGLYVYAVVPDGQEPPAARVGDMVAARGRLRVPHGYQNPGQFDMRRMLRAAGITATLAAGKQGVRVAPQEGYAFWRALTAVREHYRASMERVMPREDAAAVFALLFGGYEGVSEELVADFTTTGIVHLLSVSGSHISLLAAVLAALAALLRLPRALRAGLVIGGIAVYALLAGCVPPVIRSALMGGLTFTALALGREHSARRASCSASWRRRRARLLACRAARSMCRRRGHLPVSSGILHSAARSCPRPCGRRRSAFAAAMRARGLCCWQSLVPPGAACACSRRRSSRSRSSMFIRAMPRCCRSAGTRS